MSQESFESANKVLLSIILDKYKSELAESNRRMEIFRSEQSHDELELEGLIRNSYLLRIEKLKELIELESKWGMTMHTVIGADLEKALDKVGGGRR